MTNPNDQSRNSGLLPLNNGISGRLIRRIGSLLLSSGVVLAIPAMAIANEATDDAQPFSYDDIPSEWTDYFVHPNVIEKYTGEELREVCLEDDLSQNPDGFSTATESKPIGGGFQKTIFLVGALDFVVVDTKKVIVNLPVSGPHLVETRYCKKSLDRTKFIRFSDSIDRTRVRRCFKRNENMTIQTHRTRGIENCKIKSIHKWDGSVFINELQSETPIAEQDNAAE